MDQRLERETDVATLREAVRLLGLENARLIKLNLELRNALAMSKGDVAQSLQLQIAELEQQLAARDRALFGDSSERRDVGADSKTKPKSEAENPQSGHGPRQQVLEVIEKLHELDEADRKCKSCGGELAEWVGQLEESDEIDVIERRFVKVRHKRKKYRCGCGGCVETALGPLKLQSGGRYSIDFAIAVVNGKYLEHGPLERQVRSMRRLGLTVDSQTLWDQINALAKILSPVHLQLQNAVLAQSMIGMDETHWKLLGEKSESGKSTKRRQVWGIVSDKHVCYRIAEGRSVKDASDVLGDYQGVVMCDGYSVYSSLQKQRRGMLLAHCWAHVRRKFVEIEDVEPGRCKEVLDLIGELFRIERRAREIKADQVTHLAMRAAESKPVTDRINAWALEQRALPQAPLSKAIAYMGGLWPGLLVFLTNTKVPLDNNATERALRGVVVGRKNHYGSRSVRGTEVAALFYSIIETCKLADVDPAKYLRAAAEAAINGEPIPLPA